VSLRQDAARASAAVAMLIGINAWGTTAPDSPPPLQVQGSHISAPPIRVEAAPEREWTAQAPTQAPTPQPPATAPAPATAAQEAPAAPPVNEDEQQTLVLLADLQRYATAPADELRRELASVNQASNPRVRTDVNRIRLAVLLTIPNAGPPDDGRALALLESVAGKTGGASPLKQLAMVLYAQIAERVRNVAEERKRTALAQEKLDQLRAVERSLLLERSRNAGGAGGGGGGGTGR
jgi:hypothetical protein